MAICLVILDVIDLQDCLFGEMFNDHPVFDDFDPGLLLPLLHGHTRVVFLRKGRETGSEQGGQQ
ncbi:MAG: hypothetical protein WC126_07940 [Proteiniphilum sp.]